MYKDVFAQHTDAFEQGAHTGFILAEALKSINVKGSLINHSEHRIGTENVGKTVSLMKQHGLETIVCGENATECAELAKFSPDYIAVEPPELIGSGISVSTAKPEVITSTVEAVKAANSAVRVLCGAGVSTKEDVKKSLELGAKGVLLASAYVKAKDPVKFLQEFAGAFHP
jgi:triosephosphate isomerase